MTQNNLGGALFNLNVWGGKVPPEEAIAAFRAALEERTRQRVPLDWAATQHNLGIVLGTLGRLEEAIAAYRAALEERTRQRVPLDWAATQHNLGLVLFQLGERENGTERLFEAVNAFRDALLETTCERAPLVWAARRDNLHTAQALLNKRLDPLHKS